MVRGPALSRPTTPQKTSVPTFTSLLHSRYHIFPLYPDIDIIAFPIHNTWVPVFSSRNKRYQVSVGCRAFTLVPDIAWWRKIVFICSEHMSRRRQTLLVPIDTCCKDTVGRPHSYANVRIGAYILCICT